MAQAQFISLRGENKTTALIMVKQNSLCFSADPCYVPLAGVEQFSGRSVSEDTEQFVFEIPDGYKLVDMLDENQAPCTTKDGVILKRLAY